MLKEAKAVEDKDGEEWPTVPYHYGMGRIQAYENWLHGLSEEDQKREIAACRIRYEKHYDDLSFHVVKSMKEKGHDVTLFMSNEQKQNYIMREIFEQSFDNGGQARARMMGRIMEGRERTHER
jgi:hypothetical protein